MLTLAQILKTLLTVGKTMFLRAENMQGNWKLSLFHQNIFQLIGDIMFSPECFSAVLTVIKVVFSLSRRVKGFYLHENYLVRLECF